MSRLGEKLKQAIDSYVDADVITEELKEVTLKKVLEALDTRRIELLDIVLHLETVIADAANPIGRRHAIQFLAACLRETAQLKMNFKHVETFASFFQGKLHDWQCVEGAVGGILVLLQRQGALMRTLKHETETEAGEEPMATFLARSIFKEVHTPSHTQAVRKTILDLVHLLLSDWKEEMQLLGADLGEGIAAAVEEERDPRNLLVSFTIARQVMADFPAHCILDDSLTPLFETLSSYFPITFSPPKGDKIGITGEDLRHALSEAFCASQRMANLVIPFLLDASKDIEADVDATVAQAMQSLQFCLERFGPPAAQKYLKDILETARDQVCNTKTTCGEEFCSTVTASLKIAMKDVPVGLHPHWLSKDAVPQLKELAEDASRGRMSLASEGARQLLLAAAAAHPVIFENVWMPVMGAFQEKPGVPFQPDAVGFLADLLKARPQDAGPSAKQLQTALQGALGTLLAISPGQNGEEEDTAQLFCAAAELVRRLSLAVGEGSSADAFGALQNALLGSRSGDPGSDSWAKAWRELLSCKPISDPCVGALVQAVCDIVGSQAGRAPGLAELLLQTSPGSAQWLPLALPKLLAHTALSLSEAKLAAGAGGVDELSTKLLQRAAEVFRQRGGRHFEVLAAFAEAFCAAPKAAQPLAAELAQAMGLPTTMPELGEGLTTDLESGSPPSVDTVLQRAEAGRRFLRALCQHLPEDQARLVQRRLLESVALGSHNVLANCAALLPGILPEACGLNWNLCSKTVPAVCRCASGSDPTLAHPAAEAVALEALEALVQSCPEEEVPALLENLRDTFGQLRGVESEQSARGAAVCWASVTVALLRRGSAEQAASFLEALLGALDKESSAVGPFVPTAFRVLAPAKVEATMSSKAKLAPLALQQLSQTVLPSLVSRAKAIGSAGWARRAALESAVSLLAALAPEVACTECSDQMRFCTLTGLKRLKEDEAEASVFSVQVLQLLVRAVERNQPWVEDDLHSVVTPLCDLAGSHRTPLVRLGCFQVLSALIQQAFGHLAPFKKQIQAGCKRGIEDRCREVRLLAVAALNAWHCVGAQT